MFLELFVARRFAMSLRKEPFTLFTTSVTTASIALGYAAVCIAVSILQGYSEKIIETATRFTSDVVVRSQLSVDFADPMPMIKALRTVHGISDMSYILEREALIKHKGQLDGIMINGITPDRFALLKDILVENVATTALANGIVLGTGAARVLQANVGDTVTLILQQRSSSTPGVRRVRVAGLFQSGMGVQDDNLALLDINILRAFSNAGSTSATAILVKGQSSDLAEDIAQYVDAQHGRSVYCSTYKQVFQGVWGWIEMQRKPIPIVLGLISFVAVISIVSALLLTIVQKTRSIAILITLGMPARRIGYVILMRAMISATLGIGLGFLVTLAFAYGQETYAWIRLDSNLYYVSVLPVSFQPLLAVCIGIVVLAITATVSMIPMIIARRIKPARALRFS